MDEIKPSPGTELESHPPEHSATPSELPAPPSFTPPVHSVFLGPDGLRSGWRLLIYVVAVASLYSFFLFVLVRVHDVPYLWFLFWDKASLTFAVVAPAFGLAVLERRKFGDYGLAPAQGFGLRFWTGAAWGLGAITLLLLVLRSLHVFYFGTPALAGARILKFAIFWGAFFLLVALSEEFLLRGYTLFTLTQAIGFWPAAIALSVAFGAIHLGNRGEDLTGVLGAGMIGLFFCFTLRRTGNLWFAVGFHLAWDWGETYLYGVPDSGMVLPGHLMRSSLNGPTWLTGGTAGPEASALMLALFALVAICFAKMYPQVQYPRSALTHQE